MEVIENGCAADAGVSTAKNLSVRFVLTTGVLGSAGVLEALMMGEAVGIRCGVDV